ncbi:hypothetical protein ACFFUT_16780 [Pseudohalocynthiibacter aestuariivivens]|jgi:hypothetical protein|uniref:ABM domain-containing protein n=1 Tax=Pseudohalocynthiibacter aestuariivivens TaxID=1591409 RepID=A0ABV5JJZ7_9RHOB|nr:MULTISPECIES: hypothetical protein [Pseudohalocynthiibacter]MBS9716679.1 hypothetical protein [Pseudohalocynthiibacter aestuariivivens]MCK0101761.1 hypothetical protein [Pseudohalocynthiibacter sp. F2068]
MTKTNLPVAEVVSFELAEGISDAQFVSLSQASENFVRSAKGFLSRTLSKGEDGRWTDYVLWKDMDAAQAMAADFPKQDFAQGLMAAIAPDTVRMEHQTVLWQMLS